MPEGHTPQCLTHDLAERPATMTQLVPDGPTTYACPRCQPERKG